jgi:hypothetical protein
MAANAEADLCLDGSFKTRARIETVHQGAVGVIFKTNDT